MFKYLDNVRGAWVVPDFKMASWHVKLLCRLTNLQNLPGGTEINM